MNRDSSAVVTLARKFYMHYCNEKKWDPRPYPWSPLWAMEYAAIAVECYGYEDDHLDALIHELQDGELNAVS
jgi:hypothetical protein